MAKVKTYPIRYKPARTSINYTRKGIKSKIMIDVNSLEIFKTNRYFPTKIGMVSDNAYLSVVVTNKCQCACVYCINSETDQTLELPIDLAIKNIAKLVKRYGVKEAILLGGEPTMHSDIFGLIKRLRNETGLKFIRLTTNGIKIKDDYKFIKKLVHSKYGIQGLNISCHNINSIEALNLKGVYNTVKLFNPNCKIRVNANIWKGNNDNLGSLLSFLNAVNFVDEVRISNIIPKDSFSVNSKNSGFIGLSTERYNELFSELCQHYAEDYTLIENKKTLGFVRYVLIPTKCPIIVNWNTHSTVSDQICENNISTREINTFKCLVSGNISLSWNESNTIIL